MLIALAGIGEVALQQHVPALAGSRHWELAATCSRSGTVDGVDSYKTVAELLSDRPDIGVISLCQPPEPRFAAAVAALQASRHLMLEKPPGASVSSCKHLEQLAAERQLSLFTTWHSREADQVDDARDWLVNRKVTEVEIIWREDVRRWHAGQQWIWQAGGFGVFDPGINALSILTKVMPTQVHLVSATLDYPANRQTPIAAELRLSDTFNAKILAQFDWREEGEQQWLININTDDGVLVLANGGSQLAIDGKKIENTEKYNTLGTDQAMETLGNEYHRLYERMFELVNSGKSEIDYSALQLVADAFLMGERRTVSAFVD